MSDIKVKPIRIQLKRTKGWKMPPDTVKVDRSTRWGNPFKIGYHLCGRESGLFTADEIKTSADAAHAFRNMLGLEDRNFPSTAEIREHLRGKNLACWCKPGQPCHADVLLEIANKESDHE